MRAEELNKCVKSAGKVDSVGDEVMEQVLERLRQLEDANAALQEELREAQELGEERDRHDCDTATGS